jgi:hypothetical protein
MADDKAGGNSAIWGEVYVNGVEVCASQHIPWAEQRALKLDWPCEFDAPDQQANVKINAGNIHADGMWVTADVIY